VGDSGSLVGPSQGCPRPPAPPDASGGPQDSISAINLIEFSNKVSSARKNHQVLATRPAGRVRRLAPDGPIAAQECVSLMKGLWKKAVKSKRDTSLPAVGRAFGAGV
jgi:hypothetical protein